MTTRVERRTVAIVFVAALAIRLLYLLDVADSPTFRTPIVDAHTYHSAADAMFWQPVFYPAFLSALYAVCGVSVLWAKIVQAAIGALTCVLTFILGRRVVDRRAGLVAAAIVALYGPLIFFDGELLATGWAALWSVVLLLLLSTLARAPSRHLALALGCCAGASVLTRPTFLPFVVVSVVWLAWSWRGETRGRRVGLLALVLVGFGLATAPAVLLSGKTTGRYSFLPASGGINIHVGNNPDREATEAIRPGWAWSELTRLPTAHGVERKSETSRFFRGRFVQYVRDEPASFVAGLVAKTAELIGSRELPRNVDVYTQREWSPFLSALVWKAGQFGFPFGVLLPFAVVGLVHLGRRTPLPLLLFLGCYGAAIVLVFVAARYRAPLVPALAIAAAAGVLAFVDIVRRGERRRAGIYAAIVLAIAALSSLPGPFLREQLDYRSEMLYMVGTRMLELDEDERALELLQAAVERRPDHAETHNALGNVQFKRGDHAAAASHYRKAVEINAGFRVARDNLGRALLARGEFDEAVRQFRIVLREDPNHGAVRYYCGLALARLGKLEQAASDLTQAARLRPGDSRVLAELGRVRLRQTRFEDAIAAFRSALEIDPLHERSLGGLVLSLDSAGRADEATAVLAAALERARATGPAALVDRLTREAGRRRTHDR